MKAYWKIGVALFALLFQVVVPAATLAPEIAGSSWVNSRPLQIQDLRGQVVLVEFWTYGCINCRHVEPYVKQWHERYHPQGLVVVGVHTPEFAFERDAQNVRDYVRAQDIRYPVVLDNDHQIWQRYQNRFWSALYLIDKKGMIRNLKIGEGGYAQTERAIQELLAEPGG